MAGIAVGAQFNEWLRADVELSGHWHDVDNDMRLDWSNPSILPPSGNWMVGVEGDVNALFLLANLWIDIPLGEVVRPYVGGGAGIGRLEADLTLMSSSISYAFIDDSDWGFAYQLGAGIAFDVAQNMVIDVGYRFKAINAELEVDDDYFGPVSNTDADYRSHNVLVGLRFEF